MRDPFTSTSPHAGQPVLHGGMSIDSSKAVVVLIHGRGATAQSILTLQDVLAVPDVCYLAPQAANFTWYPNSFLAPLAANEPHLSSALELIDDTMSSVLEKVSEDQVVLMGFSQGACLALEYAARNPKFWGGVVAFSGGLIGATDISGSPPEDKLFTYPGDLENVPVFIGCSDNDPHVPLQRIDQSVAAFESMHASVSRRIYKGMGHTINDDEMTYSRNLLHTLIDRQRAPSN